MFQASTNLRESIIALTIQSCKYESASHLSQVLKPTIGNKRTLKL